MTQKEPLRPGKEPQRAKSRIEGGSTNHNANLQFIWLAVIHFVIELNTERWDLWIRTKWRGEIFRFKFSLIPFLFVEN